MQIFLSTMQMHNTLIFIDFVPLFAYTSFVVLNKGKNYAKKR